MKEIDNQIENYLQSIIDKPNGIAHLRLFMTEQNQDSYYRGVKHGAMVIFICAIIDVALNIFL